jgi:hypothetical protein
MFTRVNAQSGIKMMPPPKAKHNKTMRAAGQIGINKELFHPNLISYSYEIGANFGITSTDHKDFYV